MNSYEKLLNEAEQNNIIVREVNLKSDAKGLYIDGKIALNTSKLLTVAEKNCIMAEELAHHFSSYGNIIDDSDINNVKQERLARRLAYEKLVDLEKVADLVLTEHLNKYEIIEKLDITEEFFNDAIYYYSEKYGVCKDFGKFAIVFKPHLAAIKNF